MEVTALCISLWLNVLFLLCELDQKVDSVSLRVEPDKLQFFIYDSVTFHCEGLEGSTGWKVVHQNKGELTRSVTLTTVSTGLSCTIKNLYPEDGGEYWCEAAGGERSNSINITATDGSVILESPVRPVEGDAVTLRCRNKTSSNFTAHFYKNGNFIKTNSTGIMTFNSVSKSDAGLYKCSISGAGESPQSPLTVRGDEVPPNKSASSSDTPWAIVTFVLLVLLLVVALLHFGRDHWHRVLQYLPRLRPPRLRPGSGSAEAQTAASEADADKSTYAIVRKKKKKDKDESCGALYYTLGLDEPKEQGESTASINNVLYASVTDTIAPSTEDGFYSTIQEVGK